MSSYRLGTGGQIQLSRKLAEGGEGTIFEIADTPSILAKIYHQISDDGHQAKLVAMLKMRTAGLDSVAAWPCDLIVNAKGQTVGFTMQRVSGPGVIDRLSHPAEQRKVFPTIDYGFLVHVGMNLMRASAALHASGCTIGDVNESNVYVLSDGTIRFIDVDSFQVVYMGQMFPCRVGKPIYTPPELQNISFGEVIRTPNHDSFGLAVLIFQLLMRGCHPFAGVPTDGQGRTIEDAIRGQIYAYSPSCRGLRPPPHTLPINSLGNLAHLFERAFLSKDRPSPSEWMNVLDRARNQLRACGRNPRHRFFDTNSSCPLCAMPRDPMPSIAPYSAAQAEATAINLADLLHEADALANLKPLAERIGTNSVLDIAKNIATKVPASGFSTIGWWLLAVGLGFAIFCPTEIVLRLVSMSVGLGIGLPFIIIGAGQKRQAAKFIKHQLSRVHDATNRLAAIENQSFAIEKAAFSEIKLPHNIIIEARNYLLREDESLRKELANAGLQYRTHLLNDHLESYIIAHATIPDIKASRKAMLASFGVETAADVNEATVSQISGFGRHLTGRMLAWRRVCEQQFSIRCDIDPPIEWLASIKQRHAQSVAEACRRLRMAIDEYRQRYAIGDRRLMDAAKDVDRARDNFREIIRAIKHRA